MSNETLKQALEIAKKFVQHNHGNDSVAVPIENAIAAIDAEQAKWCAAADTPPIQPEREIAAIQKMMARLDDLLDEDQFAEIESIAAPVAVQPDQPANVNKYAEFWERLPGHLIDHYEGEELTEELLQRAAADLYAKFPDFVASGLKPFGLLLLEERATTSRLVRALAEATEGMTHMGEPVVPAQPAREWVGLTPEEIDSVFDAVASLHAVPANGEHIVFSTLVGGDEAKEFASAIEAKLREKNAGQPVVKEN